MSDELAQEPQTPGQFLEAAYARHAAACVLYAHQIVGGRLAEDACQEAFIRLFSEVMRRGGIPRAPRAWLLKTTRNVALDLLRSEQKRRRREVRAGRDEPFEADPGARLNGREVSDALAGLPQRQREVIVLRLWGEMGFAEIAETLGVAISTAHAQYMAGLAELKHKLEGAAAGTRAGGSIAGAKP